MNLVQLPVCSPSALRKAPLRSIADLAAHKRLVLSSMPEAWSQWLQFVRRPGLACRRTQEFDTMPLLMQAARDGLGVAMGIEALCLSDFEERRLVAPFRERLEGVLSLYFCCRKQDISRRPVRLFREWLMSESAT